MVFVVLVPDERGHLIPTPEDLAPPILDCGDEVMPNRYDEMFDDLDTIEKKPAAPAAPKSTYAAAYEKTPEPVVLDPFAARLGALLQNRDEINNPHPVPKTDRDEVIDALATRTTNYDRVGSSGSAAPDAFMANLLDSIIDNTLGAARYEDRNRSAEMEEARKTILAADYLRHRLPLQLASLIDAVYYKGRTDEQAAQSMGVSKRRFMDLKVRALNDLAERVVSWI